MNLKKLMKMLEAETDKEKAAEVLRKIDSLRIRKGVLRMAHSVICTRLSLNLIFVRETLSKKGILIVTGVINGDIHKRTVYISNLTMPELKSCCP